MRKYAKWYFIHSTIIKVHTLTVHETDYKDIKKDTK